MGEKIDQIERHIQKQRSELGDNISELEQKVKGAFDWRTQFEERPGVMMGMAFVGGVLLAAIVPSTSSMKSAVTSRHKSFSDPWTPYTNRDMSAFESRSASTPSHESHYSGSSAVAKKTSETWENLKGALTSLAASRVSEFVEELVPGFTEHYKKASSGKSYSPFSSGGTKAEDKSWQKANGGTDYASHS